MGWKTFTEHEKCPVCGHYGWCSYTTDGELVCCHRATTGDWKAKSGNGWIVRVGGAQGLSALPSLKGAGPGRACHSVTAAPDVAGYFEKLKAGHQQQYLAKGLGEHLGLTPGSLLILDVRWDCHMRAAAFPMRDPYGKVVGIRYRAVITDRNRNERAQRYRKDGQKWAFKGGHDGLFFNPRTLKDGGELVICEGPTDTAAALEIGLNAVGRSSCSSGRDLIRRLMFRHNVKAVTIVADDDPPKSRPDGSTFRPGIDGAVALSDVLHVKSRIVFPPTGFKDLRDWFRSGTMTREAFDRRAEAAAWRGPATMTQGGLAN